MDLKRKGRRENAEGRILKKCRRDAGAPKE
jgi:hypothetical protein